ncbi:MAG: PEP-CTERM sorting domain-containing protein [Cyanobacteria bacterium P01_F01_bin.86]
MPANNLPLLALAGATATTVTASTVILTNPDVVSFLPETVQTAEVGSSQVTSSNSNTSQAASDFGVGTSNIEDGSSPTALGGGLSSGNTIADSTPSMAGDTSEDVVAQGIGDDSFSNQGASSEDGEEAVPVPEPITVLGSLSVLGFVLAMKRKFS